MVIDMSSRMYMAEIEIDAPVDRVWAVLSDVEKWPSWTPTMSSVVSAFGSGLVAGSKFAVKQPGLATSMFTVDSVVANEGFMWSSKSMGIETIADHVLETVSESQTRVRLVLEMRGLGVGFLWLLVGKKVRAFVNTEAASLKVAVEC